MRNFRVWDIERKEYITNTGNPYVFPINGITAIKCAGSNCGSIDTKTDYSEYYILEQCIGYATKTGVKIYEGDRVKCEGHPNGLTGVIYWNEVACGFSILVDGICHYPDRFWTWCLLEVTGNIRQNPELMENR